MSLRVQNSVFKAKKFPQNYIPFTISLSATLIDFGEPAFAEIFLFILFSIFFGSEKNLVVGVHSFLTARECGYYTSCHFKPKVHFTASELQT